VLLIIDDAIVVRHTFLLPKSGDAIYRQSHDKWNEEVSEASSSKLSLELTSSGSAGIRLHPNGPCCASMSQSFAPYR
jgi:hypothetical protein